MRALGLDCEYGCEGPCEDLQHWKDRARYFHEVSEIQMARAEEGERNIKACQGDLSHLHERRGYWKTRAEEAEQQLTDYFAQGPAS